MKSLILVCVLVIGLRSFSDAYQTYPYTSEAPEVCPCSYKYDPVCGSDGITYMNKCVLEYTSRLNARRSQPPIKVVEECECASNCGCQNVDLPVCTLDGRTFPNECELACENIRRAANNQDTLLIAYRTACRGAPGHCTNISFPVCGSDNVLYRNRCVLDYVNYYYRALGVPDVTVKHIGACQDDYLCPITKQPVCASDGIIYPNRCEMEAENERHKCNEETIFLTEADQSTCNNCRCSIENDPICASDGNTYPSLCELECAIRTRKNRYLRALYKGSCGYCDCKNEYQPVCGTDRKTYDSRCWLECENIGRSEKLPLLKVFHEGKCQEFACDCSYCDAKSYEPVCGTDRITYWNLCWLECNDKCCQTNSLPSVKYYKRGPC